MTPLKGLEELPLISALLNSPSKKELFLAFVDFSFGDRANVADIREVGQIAEAILQERADGRIRIERTNIKPGRNPLSCMAYYTQEIPRLFRTLFLDSPTQSGSTSSGPDTVTIYFEWSPRTPT